MRVTHIENSSTGISGVVNQSEIETGIPVVLPYF